MKPIGKAVKLRGLDTDSEKVRESVLEPATPDEIDGTVAVMGGEDWQMWIDALQKAGVLANGAKTTAFTYLGAEITQDIYWNGSIGAAKKDLDQKVLGIRDKLAPLGGDARVSVLKAVVTQASSAIPMMPLYLSLLFKVMKEQGTHEGCIEQVYGLFKDSLYGSEPKLDADGRLATVMPHGVLFRGGAEGRIRESIVRDNLLDVVVGLPAQLFPTTGIPVCIMVFDRARESGGKRDHERNVLFIDASRSFEPGKKQNHLRDSDIAEIMRVREGRLEIERFSHRASLAEIEENGFNLNIPRYVDTFEPEPEIDIQVVQNEIRDLERQLAENRVQMNRYLKELGIDV